MSVQAAIIRVVTMPALGINALFQISEPELYFWSLNKKSGCGAILTKFFLKRKTISQIGFTTTDYQ